MRERIDHVNDAMACLIAADGHLSAEMPRETGEYKSDVIAVDMLHGDSFEVMASIESESVQLIVTSPPYADARRKQYGGVHPDSYVDWFMPFAAEMFRCLADDGSLILNIKERVVDGERSTYVHELVAAMRSAGWRWVEEYIWHKTNSAPGKWPNRFRDGWEHVYHFTKSKHFKMNQDAVKVPIGDWAARDGARKSGREESATGSGVGMDRTRWAGKDMVYPSNVLHGPVEGKNRGHSAVFPVWLPAWFIKLLSDPGDLVLDPFAGSGSTLVAALQLDRPAIGIELMADYVQIARERIEVGA